MLKFHNIKWKNLLSTGNHFTEISLDKSNNTLIVGNNGAGKSTLLDALCFVLFGKPFRKINKPNLINSINQKDCIVEIEFSISKKYYKIVRGIKPNIFEVYCDGKLIDQDSKAKDYQDHLEKFILKLNYKSFTQVVILGSASFVPFMQLSAADRRAIIEDLLDIQIFSSMNSVVKDKLSALKDSATKNKHEIELKKQNISWLVKSIEEQEKNNIEEIKTRQNDITLSLSQIETQNKEIALIQKHIDVLVSTIADKVDIENKSKTLLQLESKVEANIKKIEKDIAFYNENDSCPTCKQDIGQEFKETITKLRLSKKNSQQEGLAQIADEISKANLRLVDIGNINKKIIAHNNEIIKRNTTVSTINQYIRKLNDQILALKTKKTDLNENNTKLIDLQNEIKTLDGISQELAIEKQYYDYSGLLLKDTGIKTKIIKQYLPIMNKLINKYLQAMDFFVNFNINESFEETIKSRHRDEFRYDSFSEGEKLRIDLALLFTWRQIAKLKNSTDTNLLILDEVFDSSLDTVGTDEFLKLIHEMGTDTNVFVISHKGDQLFDKFRSVIKFHKRNNFSEIEK